jgi:hypothetical protein
MMSSYVLYQGDQIIQTCPRLSKASVGMMEASGFQIFINKILIDVDNPGHAAWSSTEEAETKINEISQLGIARNACVYATRHGYRMVWALAPLEYAYARSLLVWWVDLLHQWGIYPDDTSNQWLRLMRVPHATRDGGSSPEDLPVVFGEAWGSPVDWSELPVPWVHYTISAQSDLGFPSDPPTLEPLIEDDRVYYDALRQHPDLFDSVSRGTALGAAGDRNNAVMRAVGYMAAPQGANCTDPWAIFRILGPSVDSDRSAGAPTLDQLWGMCTRVCTSQIAENEELAQVRAAMNRAPSTEGWIGDGSGSSAAAGSTLEASAGAQAQAQAQNPPQGPPPVVNEAELSRRLVLFDGPSCWVWDQYTGIYHGSYEFTYGGAQNAIFRHCPDKIGLWGSKGTLRGINEIITLHGQKVDRVIYRAGGVHQWIPETKTLESPVWLPDERIRPVFNEQIDTWLRILGGAQQELLLDWLASVPRTDRALSMLYIRGGPGSGKSLLGNGIASLWRGDYANYEKLAESKFNERLLTTPLVWLNEGVADSKIDSTNFARQLTGDSLHDIQRKHKSNVSLVGYARLLITANNPDALSFHSTMTLDDYRAIVERIIYIDVGDRAATYLKDIGGMNATQSWVSELKLAQHLWWLYANRYVEPGARFLVEGRENDYHQRIQTISGPVPVAETLAKLIADASLRSTIEGVRVGDGEILVNSGALERHWQTIHGPHRRVPSLKAIGTAVKAGAVDGVRRSIGRGFKGYAFDVQAVIHAAEMLHIGDPDKIRETVEQAFVVKRSGRSRRSEKKKEEQPPTEPKP